MAETPMAIIRELMERINWEARLVSIKGPKGVGKSTLMKQFIKRNYPPGSRKALYCSLDALYFSTHSLVDLADQFVKTGGERLFLDEVHKYRTWSKEIKEIYDLYPRLKVVFSGSSLIRILNGDADLSRRCTPYDMQGLSFREYLRFEKDMEFPAVSLEDILTAPYDACRRVTDHIHPLEFFRDYLKHGYYPFYFEDRIGYYTHIENVINIIIESELPQERGVDIANVRKIKALLSVLSTSVPFEADIAKLSRSIGIERNTVLAYLKYLDEAKLLKLLYSDVLSVKKMQKPDKIYIDNANLLYALAADRINTGTLRECFFVNQLSEKHLIEYGKAAGDFKIDGKITVEAGGRDKGFSQLAGVPDSFIAADGIEHPYGKKIPLWIFGFLY